MKCKKILKVIFYKTTTYNILNTYLIVKVGPRRVGDKLLYVLW